MKFVKPALVGAAVFYVFKPKVGNVIPTVLMSLGAAALWAFFDAGVDATNAQSGASAVLNAPMPSGIQADPVGG
jgi:hypothetical protein